MTLTSDAVFRVCLTIVQHELPEGSHWRLALDAIEEADRLAQAPRATWPTPADQWERHVIAVAMIIVRLEGSLNIPRHRSVEIVRRTLTEMADKP